MRWTPAGNRRGGVTERDVEGIGGPRNESSQVELGPDHKAGNRQTTMMFLSVGLMCVHA